MSLVHCPSCGRQVSRLAPACPQCGHPFAAPAPQPFAPPPPPRSSSAGTVIAVVAVLGVGFVFFAGILAAIAIPRFASTAARAREEEARFQLRQIYTLEQAHHGLNGTFTANLADIGSPDYLTGWHGPTLRHYSLSVPLATGDGFCAEAAPLPTAGAIRAFSMDETGTLFEGPGCNGPVLESPATETLPPTEPLPAS